VTDPRLPPDPGGQSSRLEALDREGRARAVDPRQNVALEASAGTGKTRVLVDRYVNLLRAGVDPPEILALTFTRKAAAEMRDRIVTTLREAAARGEIAPARWRQLRDRTADVAISTIDAFCLSLLREFPLEADLDPGFSVADETEVPRLMDEALDRALRICRGVAREDAQVALVFAQLGDRRARAGLAALLGRRVVAPGLLARFLAGAPREMHVSRAARRGAEALVDVFRGMRGGLERFIDTGPVDPAFHLLVRSVEALAAELDSGVDPEPARVQATLARARRYFLTQDGRPRSRLGRRYGPAAFGSPADRKAHRDLVAGHAAALAAAADAYRRDLNVLLARGVWRMFAIAETEYRRTLDARAVLDFSDLLLRALALLRQMEEFAQSRFRLESRYHHLLVDEFQDTSRAQWDLVSLLVEAWGEGAGLAHAGAVPPSIFIVGDRKQSIYGFRDAEVSLFAEASRYIGALRPGGDVRRSISRSFRAVAPLLAFVNDVCEAMPKLQGRADAFAYAETDRFPVEGSAAGDDSALALVVAGSVEDCAAAVAGEIRRLLDSGADVRDRATGMPRAVRPGDVAVLFRTRDSHRAYETALERAGLPAYVYQGLGFFDAPEIRDVLALLWYLAEPRSDLRAAAFLRSRLVRLSDEGLRRLGPGLADALLSPGPPTAALDAEDADVLAAARGACARWRDLVDRVSPAELLDRVLIESAYAVELRGVRLRQARENLKKIRGIVRRIQNRGYATLHRVVSHLDRLAVGEEANAVLDAADSVSLMTVHASKGLEFPVVFLVDLARGTGGRPDPIRVAGEPEGDAVSVAVGDVVSVADEDAEARDREEAKRLLYVALTRARDRLYLGAVLPDGLFRPGRLSLGEVLPVPLRDLLQEAVAAERQVSWSGPSGVVHRLRVCRSLDAADARVAPQAAPGEPGPVDSDFASLRDASSPAPAPPPSVPDAACVLPDGPADGSDRVVGTLVHRLVQLEGLGAGQDRLRATGEALVADLAARADQAWETEAAALVDRAVSVCQALWTRADLRGLYQSGQAYHEVPFCLRVDGRLVRGAVDCLIVTAGGAVTILELKTGRARPEHQAQLDLYRQAALALFPGAAVDARLVYA
jgi:ATP-dependent helicase/nuclease subunit A